MTTRDPLLYLGHIRDALDVDDEIVWTVVEAELPKLRDAIERLLAWRSPRRD